MTVTAVLALEDGTIFNGQSIGAKGNTTGEVVFNTALTGYQEILTDPSYSRQIVTLTYPHIGNTGTTPEDLESPTAYAAGLVVRDVPPLASNWRKSEDLREFLDAPQGRRDLRHRHAQAHAHPAREGRASRLHHDRRQDRCRPPPCVLAKKFPGLKGMDLAKVVTTKRVYQWNDGSLWQPENRPVMRAHQRLHVVAYDFGVKRNILRMLGDRGCRMTVVPAQTTAEEVLALEPDGVFLSNGPGDPEPCDYAIEAIRALVVADLPVFGICLGHQLLGLASGARTMKMKFGHHGANHPVQDLETGRVFITSQNHGFAVDESDLPSTLKPTHRSLFDGSLQGIARIDKPAFSFQGHPEASPGPQDMGSMFDRFVHLMLRRLQQKLRARSSSKPPKQAAEG